MALFNRKKSVVGYAFSDLANWSRAYPQFLNVAGMAAKNAKIFLTRLNCENTCILRVETL